MSSPISPYDLEHRIERNSPAYHAGVNSLVIDVIRGVDRDMRRQPAHMVYEMMSMQLANRLPGVSVEDEALRDAAARIAAGLPVD